MLLKDFIEFNTEIDSIKIIAKKNKMSLFEKILDSIVISLRFI